MANVHRPDVKVYLSSNSVERLSEKQAVLYQKGSVGENDMVCTDRACAVKETNTVLCIDLS